MIEVDNIYNKPVVSHYNKSTSFADLLSENGLKLQETPSPLQQTDEENKRAIESPNNSENFTLESPRIVAVGKLDIAFFSDISFAVIADENNVPYAIVHNVSCISKTLENKGLLSDRETQSFDDSFLVAPGTIRGVDWWMTDTRVDSLDANMLFGDLPAQINGIKYSLPVIEAKGMNIDGEIVDCPTVVDKVLGAINIEDLSTRFGQTLGNVVQGLEEGFDRGRNN